MKMRPTRVEWEVEDESNADETPQSAQGNPVQLQRSNRWRGPLIVLAGSLLLLVCFIVVACLVDRAERNIAQTEKEIELAVEADSWLQDPAAPKPQIQTIELHDDLAIVHTSVAQMSVGGGVLPQESPATDGTIVYRLGDKGWERIEPNEADPGAYRHHETDHLLLQYRQEDYSLVEAIVPAVESFTSDLQRDLGLDLHPAGKKVTVRIAIVAATQRVDLADPFELVNYVAWESDGIAVLSPRLLRVSTTQATANTLTQAVNATVAHRTILLAVEEYQPQAVWRPLVDGLQLWAYSTHREFDFDLADQMNKLLRQQLAGEGSLRLPVLSTLSLPLHNIEESQVTGWQQSVVPKSVIDYIIATYGRHSLAWLLDGMHQYDSWQGLIPALFGVSKEEFESGWQAYLAAR